MKKRSIVLLLISLLILSFTACGGKTNEEYHNVTAQNNVYSMGTQSVTIEGNSLNDAPAVVFKKSISPADIVLGGALVGKTVTKVTYNEKSSITVELSGNAKVKGGIDVYGSIKIKHTGLESKGSSVCLITVLAPEISVASSMTGKSQKDGKTVYNVTTMFYLPVGEFTDKANAENVTLAEGVEGNLTVELSDGKLTVTVKNCNVENPTVKIGACVTTIGKEVVVELGRYIGAEF